MLQMSQGPSTIPRKAFHAEALNRRPYPKGFVRKPLDSHKLPQMNRCHHAGPQVGQLDKTLPVRSHFHYLPLQPA